jgi:3-phosphoshikimate 1-carboxyvinyltransferase
MPGRVTTIDCGHGGTPARFLLAAACLSADVVVIDGSDRLRQRPMAEGVELLRALGATIVSEHGTDRLPLRVESCGLRGGRLRVGSTASSQYISALMLIAPFLDEGIELEFDGPPTSAAYIRLTANELEAWGAGVELQEHAGELELVRVRPGMLASRSRTIEPDASSAAYWAVAAAINPGSRVSLLGLQPDDVQPDAGVFDAIIQAGAAVETHEDGCIVHGPRTVRGWSSLDASGMPDGAVALAVMAACAVTTSTITGLSTLRVKESDRIGAIQTELQRCGAEVHATDHSLRISPIPTPQLGAEAPGILVRTYDDHRMAMAFSILGLRRGGIRIEDPECVTKSYPGFYKDLETLQA